MSSLKEKLRGLSENKRTYLLMRVAGMKPETAREFTGIQRGTYNAWFGDVNFVQIHQQLPDLVDDYRQEAIQMLRRDNQLQAVLLEGDIILKMRQELITGEYNLIKSNLAKEVYSKLITDLDAVPKNLALTWEQRILGLFGNSVEQGETIDGELEEASSEPAEYTEGNVRPEALPAANEATQEDTQDEELVNDNNESSQLGQSIPDRGASQD